jgi:outer membrane protein OmpA-like peptidoglycan-associated protein
MHRGGARRFVLQAPCALLLASGALRAEPGDADNAQDYPGFPRQPGFQITDYAEDNPAEADFPVARPLPLDAAHVDLLPIRGHRFVIRYQVARGVPPTVYQTQLYYEKLAARGGYQVVKSGAVGDVSETFCCAMANHDIWVSVEPANDVNVVTVVEAPHGTTPIPSTAEQAATPTPRVPATPTGGVTNVTVPTPRAAQPGRAPAPSTQVAQARPQPASQLEPLPAPPKAAQDSADADGEALYTSLTGQGRLIVPFVFDPGKDDLDSSSQPLVDRIVAMMQRHADLSLRIEGHTDNSGDPDANMRLSAERAFAIRDKLVAANIDRKRIDAVGVGGLQPLADNGTAEGRAKNRRIELVVWKRYSHQETPPPTANNG